MKVIKSRYHLSKYMRCVCSALTLVVSASAIAQNYSPLKIGDSLPDITLRHVVNYMQDSLRTSDLKDTSLVIDFWSTYCGSCIEHMPMMQQLQHVHRDKLKILHVTDQTVKIVQQFYQRRKDIEKLGLPIIAQDSILKQLFPHQTVPHIVLIDKKGRVKAITSSENITERNIQNLINGSLSYLPIKKDILDMDYDYTLPFALLKFKNNLLEYSVLSGKIEGLRSILGFSYPDSNTVRIGATNIPLLNLLFFAMRNILKEGIAYYKNRIVYDSTDSRVVELLTRSYCYELMINANDSQAQALSVMKRDLENKLSITVNIVNRERECYVVKKNIGGNTSNAKKNESATKNQITDGIDSIELKNLKIKRFFSYVYKYYPSLQLPLIYEGNPDDSISILLPKTIDDSSVLEKILSIAGYSLAKEKRMIMVLDIQQ